MYTFETTLGGRSFCCRNRQNGETSKWRCISLDMVKL